MIRLLIDPSSKLPRHAQVERLLRRLIAQKSYANGKPLPGEMELAEQLKVSRQTVRQAMTRLVHEGLIERRRNAGTRVSQTPLVTNLSDWASFTAEMGKRGVQMRTVRVSAKQTRPPTDVAKFFSIKPNIKALQVTRVRGDADGPVVEFRSWLHPRLGLKPSDDFTQPLYDLIADRTHITPSRSSERIGAVLCDAELSASLAYPTGKPVLTRRRFVSDSKGLAVEVCDCFYRADRFTYSIELLREDV